MRLRVFAVVVIALLSGAAVAGACPPPGGTGGGAATITGSFADACRDFAGTASRDISLVEIHYADGRVVRDTTAHRREVSIDGEPGDEIVLVVVKAGTTRTRFTCTAGSPPVAALQARGFQQEDWSDAEVFCSGSGLPDPTACMTFRFRGTNSSDPDNDIATWSIAFGDGTSTAGSWTADPPADVAHTYASDGFYTAELTVTDAAGHAGSDTITFSIDTDGAD